jgi:hypothetical protein
MIAAYRMYWTLMMSGDSDFDWIGRSKYLTPVHGFNKSYYQRIRGLCHAIEQVRKLLEELGCSFVKILGKA